LGAVEEIHVGTALRILQDEVKQGLRVKLAYIGLTGTAYLELDYEDPRSNPPLPIEWEPLHPYVPSASSFITRIFSTTEEFFSRLKKLDIESLLTNLDKLAIEVNRKLQQVPVERLSSHAIDLLEELRETNRRLQEVANHPAWDQIPREAATSLTHVRELLENPAWTNSLTSLERSLRSAESLLSGREGDVAATLENLRVATEQLRSITENAKRYPAQVLFGDPPKPLNPKEERR
jgi:ABC-type transporter Mla subunit MlaD